MAYGKSLEKLNQKVLAKPELLIIFAGDSHTWGQGASGWGDALKPRFVGGEWRRLPEYVPSFPQLFWGYLKSRRPSPQETYMINSGYGCASTRIYLTEYWSRAVEVYQPDIVVLEFAINDWISDRNISVREFSDNLNIMIDKCVVMDSVPILLTVSPIRGSQFSGDHFYQDYIDCTRLVADKRPEAILADANERMSRYIDEDESHIHALFDDDWHVAQPGQDLYCRALIEAVEGA